MSNLLFAIDHIFQASPERDVYTTGGKFPYSAWTSYLEHFDTMTVFSRGRRLQGAMEAAHLSRASGPRVEFRLMHAQRGLSRAASLFQPNESLKYAVKNADAVIARLPSEYGLAAIEYAKAAGKPYLVELVACPWDALWHHGGLIAKAYAPVLAARTRRALKDAPLARYVTAKFLQERYPTAGHATTASNVILNSASSLNIKQRALRFEVLRAGNPMRPLTIGTIGALHTRLKGVQTAIATLADVRDALPPFRYRVLGEGDPSALVKLAKRHGVADCVHFDGVLPAGEAVAGWLDDIDIYLQPSFQEGLPRGLIEALSRGCLALGSTAGGIPELLPRNRLHRPGHVAGLRSGLQALWTMVEQSQSESVYEAARNIDKASEYSPNIIMARRNASVAALKNFVPILEPRAFAHA